MKILLLAATAAWLLFASAYAQNNNKTRFGVKGGLNVSVFNKHIDGFGEGQGSDYYGYHKYPRFSVNLGGTADINISNKFAVGLELQYTGLGSAYRIKNQYVVVTTTSGIDQDAYDYIKFRVNYFELPLLAKYTFSYRPGITCYTLYGGLAPAVNVTSGLRATYYDLSRSTRSNVPVKNEDTDLDDVRSFNISGVLGLQLGTPPNHRGFYGDIRLQNTLMPVFNINSADFSNGTKMFNGSLGLGFRF